MAERINDARRLVHQSKNPIEVGKTARVREPFAQTYPDVYKVHEAMVTEDGEKQFLLEGVGGWFAERFLESV